MSPGYRSSKWKQDGKRERFQTRPWPKILDVPAAWYSSRCCVDGRTVNPRAHYRRFSCLLRNPIINPNRWCNCKETSFDSYTDNGFNEIKHGEKYEGKKVEFKVNCFWFGTHGASALGKIILGQRCKRQCNCDMICHMFVQRAQTTNFTKIVAWNCWKRDASTSRRQQHNNWCHWKSHKSRSAENWHLMHLLPQHPARLSKLDQGKKQQHQV